MDNFYKLKNLGGQAIEYLLAGKKPQINPQLQQGFQNLTQRFQEFQQSAVPLSQTIKNRLWESANEASQEIGKNLRFIRPEEVAKTRYEAAQRMGEATQKIQSRFNALKGDFGDMLKPRIQEFTQDFQTRFGRVNERYIQPVVEYGQNLAAFAGIGTTAEATKRRANFAQLPIAKMTPEDMALNFTPTGMTVVESKLAPRIAEEGKKLLEALPKNDRLNHLMTYANKLLSWGFSKPQIDKISAPEAATILKNKMRPSDVFGEIKGSGNESNRFIQDMQEEAAKLKNPNYSSKEIDSLVNTSAVKSKTNLLDYIRTPARVFEKIGLKKESDLLRTQYDKYIQTLPGEIDKITEWSKRVAPDANERIFNWLDGKKVNLADNELQVATEIKANLKDWAAKLKLPETGQISNYITHLFEKGAIEKEFDPEVAKLIRGKVSASVHDPFLQKRINKPEYLQDTWRALQAYFKRANRKFYMDPALEKIAAKAENLPTESYNYVKSQVARINMQPTDLDNLLDNLVKSSPIGYKLGQRPTNIVTRNARQAVFRSLLGLNPLSALRNLQQSTNTYSVIGEKNFGIGLIKTIKNLPKFLLNKETELEKSGVMANFIEDRNLSAVHKFWQKTDEVLFYMFQQAEKINRGIAYFGAEAKGLSEGMSKEAATEYAKGIVRKTQFQYDVVDTPAILQSDIAKTLGQFGTYPLKQGEFLIEMAKNKDIVGSLRWLASNVLFIATIGKVLGLDYSSMIPTFRFGVPTLTLPIGAVQAVTQGEDKYGNKLTTQERILNPNVTRGALNYMPAGGQLKKTYEGIKALREGGSYTPSGMLRYPVEGIQPAIFGPGTTPGAQRYYDGGRPLSEGETATYKLLLNSGYTPTEAHQLVVQTREEKPDLQPKQGFDLFGLFKPEKSNITKLNPTGNPLIDAVLEQKEITKNEKLIKDVFDLGLPKVETEAILQKQGLTWETASIIMMKGLPIESGSRGKFLKKTLSGLGNEEFKQTALYLAEVEVLSTGVTAKWLDDGEISKEQKKMLDQLIAYSKGKTDTISGNVPKAKKLRLLPVRSIRPTIKKVTPVKITAPKLRSTTEVFKPLQYKKPQTRRFMAKEYGSVLT